MRFRDDINTLRAIAVIGVILFHFQVPYFSGGFSGVDVFFVISGYLMSRIVLTAINNGTFSLRDFYIKRLKRIVPALLFLILVFTVASFFVYFPKDYRANQEYAASSILFISNFLYWHNSNYFEQNADNAFLHTWSLSAEWQFYILYPIILLLAGKVLKSKLRYFGIYAAITAAICLGTLLFSLNHTHAAFYLLPTRAWEMMLGGIAFLSQDYFKKFKHKIWLVSLCYLLILSGFLFIQAQMIWPGVFTLIPVISTAIILTCDVNDFKFWGNRFVQFTGNISYSLYLWHWPVYVFALYLGVDRTLVNIVIIIMVSFAFAYFSYRYIESIKLENRIKYVLACMLFLAASGGALNHFNINEIMFKPEALRLSNYTENYDAEKDRRWRLNVCFVTWDTEFKGFDKVTCLATKPGKKNVLLLGDSHAATLYQSLAEELEKQDVYVLQATTFGCYPISKPEGERPCVQLMDYIYSDFIQKNVAKIDGVILCCHWIEHITCKDDYDWAALKATITFFKQKHIKITLIGQNESYIASYPFILAKEVQYNRHIVEHSLDKLSTDVDLFLKKNLQPYYINIYNTSIPPMSAKGDPYMIDDDHFSTYGSDVTIQKIVKDTVFKRFISSLDYK